MKSLCRFSATLIIAAGFCRLSAGATIVVDPYGGGDFRAIQPAVDAAASGDTVLLSNGFYVGIENRNIDLQGKALTIRSENGPYLTVIDCGKAAANGFLVSPREDYGAYPDVLLSGLTIRDATDAAVFCGINTETTIKDCILAFNSHGVRSIGFADIFVLDSAIHNNSADGIRFNLSHLSIDRCSIFANGANGIFGSDEFRGTITNSVIRKNKNCGLFSVQCPLYLTNCAIVRNGDGIIADEGVVIATNCTVASNLRAGVRAQSISQVDLKNCIVWDHESGSIVEEYRLGSPRIDVIYSCIQGATLWPGEGNINLDPRLRNFRLSPGSPAIDAGTLDGAPETDLTGNPRPAGAGVDMGAFEFRRAGGSLDALDLEEEAEVD